MQNSLKIPEGWSVKKLGDIGKICMCKRIFKEQTHHCGEVPFYKIGTFGEKADAFISWELFAEYKQKYSYPKIGDILISCSGTIGRTVIFNGQPSYFQDSNIVWINNDENILLNQYLFYLYNIIKWKSTESSTIARLYNDNIKNTKIYFPPLPEQEKIAGILSCWDDGIEKLSALIEKKKIQKKALMQQLLTGKHRLKGFSSPWHEVKLGNIGTTYTGLSGKDKESFGYGKPYIPYLNIYQNFVIDTNQFELVAIKDGENQNTVKYGDIFFTTSSETPDEVGISSVLLEEPKEETYLNSFCFGFRLHDFSILLPFYAAYLCRSEQIRKTMYMLAQGATRFNLSKTEFLKSYIYIPSDLAEQKAIAEILSKADEEIELLNKKLEAFKQEKKALMQQLLTGKIRVKVN